MVIAKAEWFNNKKGKYFNFGITWQGGLYILLLISVLFTGLIMPQTLIIQLIFSGLFILLIMDFILASYKAMDEREKSHYSIAMRNMAWGMIATMVLASIVLNYIDVENSLTVLIYATGFVGAVIGIVSNYKLKKDD
jgi:hypothetical protein